MHLLRKMDTRLDDLTTRVERIEAGRRSPSPRQNASDLRCQGCGMSEEIEAPRPVPPDAKPVTEAPTLPQHKFRSNMVQDLRKIKFMKHS